MIVIYIDENEVQWDITDTTGNLSRSDSIDTLGEQLTFDYVGDTIPMGGRIAVVDTGLMWYGSVITGNRKGVRNWSYTCYDDAYQLNKNNAFIQFNHISVKDAITKLCEQYNIPLSINCELNTLIDKIYDGTKISDVIKELLGMVTDETQEKFRLEYSAGQLVIDKYSNLIVYPTYNNGGDIIDCTRALSDYNYTESIENLCNKVVILSSNENNTQAIAEVEDTESQTKYGQYTHYEKIDDKDIAQARNIADQKLKELNKMETTLSVGMLGDNIVRSGRCIYVDDKLYLVKSCSHKYNTNTHIMEVELCGLMN